ncbi:hypothetical protein Gpo141_00004206 [Globisporangium polare]
MWTRSLAQSMALAAVLVANVALKVAATAETDEFDAVDAQVAQEAAVAAATVPFNPNDLFYLEAGSWVVAALYVVCYFLGKWQNKRIANQWLDDAQPHLVKQFAYTGATAKPVVGLLEESNNNFKYYCTGRRFCSRLVVDLQLAARHDFFSRLFRVVAPIDDFVTFDISLNAADLDPFIFSVSKKLEYNALTKVFPELISIAKRVPSKDVPDAYCVTTDHIEVPKVALTKQFQNFLKDLEDHLDYMVITDMNTRQIVGIPYSDKRILRLRFKLWKSSKKLDSEKAVLFAAYLIDAIGSTMKLSRDEQARRLNELKEKKQKEYESLSYEQQQKLDALNQKKMQRKRVSRKD